MPLATLIILKYIRIKPPLTGTEGAKGTVSIPLQCFSRSFLKYQQALRKRRHTKLPYKMDGSVFLNINWCDTKEQIVWGLGTFTGKMNGEILLTICGVAKFEKKRQGCESNLVLSVK